MKIFFSFLTPSLRDSLVRWELVVSDECHYRGDRRDSGHQDLRAGGHEQPVWTVQVPGECPGCEGVGGDDVPAERHDEGLHPDL